jgi:heme/copper-type cytochrome/quinol oxidase subunit 1
MNRIPQLWFLWTAAFFLVLQTFFTFFFGNPTIDFPLRDTYFVFSASWLLMLLAGQMVLIAVIYWTFGKMKRRLHQGLGKIHFFITIGALIIFGIGLIHSGFFDNSRLQLRIDGSLFDYKLLIRYNRSAGFFLLFAQLIFIINCLFALFIRPKKQKS